MGNFLPFLYGILCPGSHCLDNAHRAILGGEILLRDALNVAGRHFVDLVELPEQVAPVARDDMVECQLRRQP